MKSQVILLLEKFWNKGADSISYKKNRVNRAGSTHFCIINGDLIEFETLDVDAGSKPLVYSERSTSVPYISQMDNFYAFNETETGTNIELTLFVTFKKYRAWAKYLLKGLFRKNILKGFNNLKDLAEQTGLKKLQEQVIEYEEP